MNLYEKFCNKKKSLIIFSQINEIADIFFQQREQKIAKQLNDMEASS